VLYLSTGGSSSFLLLGFGASGFGADFSSFLSFLPLSAFYPSLDFSAGTIGVTGSSAN
jgi:hypothetical protein